MDKFFQSRHIKIHSTFQRTIATGTHIQKPIRRIIFIFNIEWPNPKFTIEPIHTEKHDKRRNFSMYGLYQCLALRDVRFLTLFDS